MLIVHVHVHVKPESVAEFRQATLENARSSVQEPGIARFDVVDSDGFLAEVGGGHDQCFDSGVGKEEIL